MILRRNLHLIMKTRIRPSEVAPPTPGFSLGCLPWEGSCDPYRNADNYMLGLKRRVGENRLNHQPDNTRSVRVSNIWERVVHRIVSHTEYHERVVTK